MWQMAVASMVAAAGTLVGSWILRALTRFALFYSMVYYGDILSGSSNTADLVSMILNPQDRINEVRQLAFGAPGVVSWGNFILWETDLFTPLRYFLSAVASWWIVKQWMTLAK